MGSWQRAEGRCYVAAAALVVMTIGSGGAVAADRALLIGINDYSQVDVDAPSLRGALNDVADVSRLLREGFGVPASAIRTLTDADAGKQAILDAMDEWLVEGTAPGDRVFLHYSGHGHYQADQPGGDESGPNGDGRDEVLIPYDTHCAQWDERGASARECVKLANVVRDDDIAERLARLQGREVMLMMDACYAATLSRGLSGIERGDGHGIRTFDSRLVRSAKRRSYRSGSSSVSPKPDPEVLRRQKERPFLESSRNTVAFYAAASNQLAPELVQVEGRQRRTVGLLSSGLVEGLLEAAADYDSDGRVTYAELLEYLRAKAAQYCEDHPHKPPCRTTTVTPQLEISENRYGQEVLAFGRGDPDPVRERLPEGVDDVLRHGNDAGLRVAIEPSPTLVEGELMRLRVSAARDGYLLLFDVDAEGRLTQLYPNAYTRDGGLRPDDKPLGWVRGDRPVLIPDSFTPFRLPAREPFGEGRIVAVLVEDEIGLDILAPATRGFEAVAKPGGWLARLRARLDSLVHNADGTNRAVRWSFTTAQYRIEPRP